MVWSVEAIEVDEEDVVEEGGAVEPVEEGDAVEPFEEGDAVEPVAVIARVLETTKQQILK